MPKQKPYTHDEVALAQQMFARDEKNGTLKKRPALGVVTSLRRPGPSFVVPASKASYRDYLKDARERIARRKSKRS